MPEPRPRTPPLSVRVDAATYEAVTEAVVAAGTNRNTWLTEAITEKLTRQVITERTEPDPAPTKAAAKRAPAKRASAPAKAAPPAAAKSRPAATKVKVQHRTVGSMHQWRINPADAPANAATRAMVLDAVRARVREADGITGPIDVDLVAWKD
jgi:hypothetical protein